MLAIEVIRDAAGFDQLEPSWNRLLREAKCDGLFLSFAWLRTWWRFYGEGKELFILVVKAGDEPVAIAPFHIDKRRFVDMEQEIIGSSTMIIPRGPWDKYLTLKELCFLGGGEVCSDYLDVICRKDREVEAIRAIEAFLLSHRDKWDAVDLSYVAADSLVATLLSAPAEHHIEVTREPLLHTIVTALPGSMDEYMNTMLSAKSRANIRRYGRKFFEQFPTAVFRLHEDPATLDQAMDSFIALHQTRWSAKGEPGAFARKRFNGFHRAVARLGLAQGWLRLGFLETGTEKLFATYSFRCGDRISLYQMGMQDLPDLRLGTIALSFCIEKAIGEGARVFDFLRGEEDYKKHWAKDTMALLRIQWLQRNRWGGIFRLHRGINTSPWLRAVLKRGWGLIGRRNGLPGGGKGEGDACLRVSS